MHIAVGLRVGRRLLRATVIVDTGSQATDPDPADDMSDAPSEEDTTPEPVQDRTSASADTDPADDQPDPAQGWAIGFAPHQQWPTGPPDDQARTSYRM